MSDQIDPALLDRARKAWPECGSDGRDDFMDYCAVANNPPEPCDLHAAWARTLEEYGTEQFWEGIGRAQEIINTAMGNEPLRKP